tara:strand:+ start:205 stop:768 length:564 start_codon:yes stop_codon:yes gene_type:complete
MSETTMPAAEAAERKSYELAFHVLPTVAEGEVSGVFDAVKALITTNGGELFDEEAPERFDLAYEIVKHIEGKNRKFQSAYFGWVRFNAQAQAIAEVTQELEADTNILRYMVLKLTKVEEENPFRFHEALAAEKTVTTVEESAVVPDVTTVEKTEEPVEEKKEEEEKTEEATEVDQKEIDQALEKSET